MSDMPIKRNDVGTLAHPLTEHPGDHSSTEAVEESSKPPGGQKSPALAAGLAALFLASPAIGSVAEATAGSHPSFRDQFASSFTREVLLPDDVCGTCTVKLPE
jgi:hypothetical protein